MNRKNYFQQIETFLEQVQENDKNNNRNDYDYVINFFKFIFSCYNNSIPSDNSSAVRGINYIYDKYVFTNDTLGILDLFKDIYQNPNREYFEEFKKVTEPHIDMFNNHLFFSRDKANFLFYNINLYTLLSFYHQDNFSNFNAACCDIGNTLIGFNSENSARFPSIIPESCKELYDLEKKMIDELVSNENYYCLSELRNILKNHFMEINSYTNIVRENVFNRCIEASKLSNLILEDYKSLKKDGYCIDTGKLSYERYSLGRLDEIYRIYEIINLCILHCTENYIETGDSLDERKKIYSKKNNPYYAPILLFGNRYEYNYEKLNVIEDNPKIKEDIFNHIKEIPIDMFKGENKENDLFIELLDLLYDSDNYEELQHKLNILDDTCRKYKNGNESSFCALDMINYMKQIPSDLDLIKTSKPKMIINRMVVSYTSKIDGDIDYLVKCHDSAQSIDDCLTKINKESTLEKNKKNNKVKRRLFGLGGPNGN